MGLLPCLRARIVGLFVGEGGKWPRGYSGTPGHRRRGHVRRGAVDPTRPRPLLVLRGPFRALVLAARLEAVAPTVRHHQSRHYGRLRTTRKQGLRGRRRCGSQTQSSSVIRFAASRCRSIWKGIRLPPPWPRSGSWAASMPGPVCSARRPRSLLAQPARRSGRQNWPRCQSHRASTVEVVVRLAGDAHW